jgi:aspartyl-tRNA(Asn)/glutamyl-tRNA(Gln) amidotransferase subunit B
MGKTIGASPNSRTCPVCLGHPGSLPVMNRQAYEFSVRTALALNCTIAGFTKWDRKSYYYPDLPKNYQISQYDLPLSHDGWMETLDGEGNVKRVRIIRAHLEEDAGKLLHEGNGPFTQVDLNRTGTPLLEIVTEPDMHSPAEVGNFGRELRRLVRHLGVSEANMQMGQMRLEPNINCIIRTDGKEFRTPIAEVKNLNSFKHVEAAIAYEAERQVAQWRRTGAVLVSGNKSTLGWDPDRGVTVLQREKEEAHDYRYFPDPDLLPVVMDDAWLKQIAATVVEVPLARRKRYVEQFGMDGRDADQLIEERATCELFESAAAELGSNLPAGSRRLVKLLLSEGVKRANERDVGLAELPISPARWAELVRLLEAGKISATAATAVLDEMLSSSPSPATDGAGGMKAVPSDVFHPVYASETSESIAQRLGLIQTSDASAIEPIIDELLAANPAIVADAKGAKGEKALGGLIGQVLKRVRGANPSAVRELLKKKLGLG